MIRSFLNKSDSLEEVVIHVVLNVWVVVVPVSIVMFNIEMTVRDSVTFVEDVFEWSVLILDEVSKRLRSKVGWCCMEVVLIHKIVVCGGEWCVMGSDVMVRIVVKLWLKEVSKVWLDVVGSINTVTDVFVHAWLIMMVLTCIELSVWHIEVIVVDWLVMALLELVVLVLMASWVNRLEHIMVRVLNEV